MGPLLAEFSSGMRKNAVMESLDKLGEAPEVYRRVSVSHDLYRAEREHCKMLVHNAKEQQEQDTGEFIYGDGTGQSGGTKSGETEKTARLADVDPQNLLIMYTNADSRLNKCTELKLTAEGLRHRPHVICITEINPKNIVSTIGESELNFQGYN